MSTRASSASHAAPAQAQYQTRPRRAQALLSTLLLTAGLLVAVNAAPAAAAPAVPTGLSPIAQRTAGQVTADALPTVQIDGVAWSQAVVGSGSDGTVYVGGSFANARPAGAAAGSNQTPRGNLLAYNIGTGNLVTAFAPNLNAQVLAVTASPDGTRIYVGGDFTTADGVTRNRIAAYSTATGQLISSFAPNINDEVKSIVATNTTVYVGGDFQAVGGVARTRLAAVSAATGALLNWAPTADATVNAMVLTPDGTKLVVGGAFQYVNGSPAYGLAEIDARTGGMVPWAVNQKVRDAGVNSAIESLTTDGTSIFGTGYVFGAGGNLEGTFSADPTTGAINWIEDCHGDTYSSYPLNGALYTVSHSHYCANMGGYFQSNPLVTNQRRAQAYTIGATGTVAPNSYGNYFNWGGNPSPSMINWFPDLVQGTYTGQGQAAWSVTGNDTYVVLGGEFPYANGVAQQGLVRFAVKAKAPNTQGPRVGGTAATPTLVSTAPGTVRVAFQANWDRDDKNLTYKLLRDGSSTTPIYTVTTESEYWNRPALGFTDTGLAPGSSHNYRVSITDSDGNTVVGAAATITVAGTSTLSAYAKDVLAAGASHYWRLNEASGTKVVDYAAYDDATAVTAITRGATGPISGDSSTASTFDGTASLVVNSAPAPAPNTFSVGAWFNTTSTTGGKIVGYGNENAGTSTQYDRHIYMDAAGLLHFGVGNGSQYRVDSTAKYNDGNWHQVVGTFGAGGVSMYVDGQLIGTNQGTTVATGYTGFWRIGGDTPWSGNPYFKGSIAEVAIYPTAISGVAVRQQYVDSGRTFTGIAAPTDAFGQLIYQDNPALYYRMDDTSGTNATDSSGNAQTGIYRGGVTLGAASNVVGTSGTAVTLNGASGTTVSSPTSIASTKTFSQELWFKTTSTVGGELMDFGSASSGNSGTYNDVLSLANNGQVSFRVRQTTTTTTTISTPTAYNNGVWHHVVATVGPDGMKLYLDGALKGTNANTKVLTYNGFWRFGGDAGYGGSSTYLAGSIDEAAVYNYPLTAAQVLAHRNASPSYNRIPTPVFTSTVNKLGVGFDGSTSTDPDGSIASYSWNFGDGTAVVTGSAATTSHAYTTAGTYSVTLTVTDNAGGVNVITNPVTVVANLLPTAAFAVTTTGLALSVDATRSADTDGSIASYAWNYGDNSPVVTGSTPTSSYTYAASGTYTVTLTVTDNNGATTVLAKSVTVSSTGNVAPATSFTATAAKLAGSFDASASTDYDGSITSYAWDYGDGTPVVVATTAPTSTHTYTAAGTYTVSLTVTDNAGATTTATRSLTVVANVSPTASFTSAATKLNIAFDGSASADSDGTIASYAWNFGDGSAVVTNTTPKTSYTYAYAGTYSVTLTVTDDNGVSTSVSNSVTAVANVVPTVSFTAKPTKLAVAFDASASTDSDGTIKSYTWRFGDNAVVTTTTPTTSHTYSAAGTYSVKLTVTDDNSGPSALTQSVTVVVNAPPTSSFTATTNRLAVAFNGGASADSDGTISSYAWNYGDNSAAVTTTGPTTNYTYAAAGTYTVTLTTTDNNGATTTSTQSVKVSAAANVAPTASFTATATKLSVAVDGSASADSDGAVASYTWNYGDNSAAVTTTTPTTSYTYAAAGTYTITLTVTDSSGATASTTRSVTTVANVLPTANFTATVSKLSVAVDASASTDSDGTIASYSVNYGDGTVAVSGKTSSHVYASAGTFTITLTVTDNNGGTATTTRSITTVNNVAPTAGFTATPAKLVVAFDGSTSKDTDGTIASYAWNYGDNSAVVTGTTPTTSYTYAAAGTYTVTLTVTDDNGATATSSKTVTVVANVPPTSSFAATPNNLAVAFDGSGSADSDGTIASYAWNYGDNSAVVTKTTPTTSYTYAAAGTYTVTLTVTDNNGATATSSQTFTFRGATNLPPTASFTSTATKASVVFDGSASKDTDGTISSYAWNYGDNSAVVTGTSPTSTHVYAASGTYTVTLTVTDNSGASTVATKSITVAVNVAPTSSFTTTINKLAVAFDGSASADSDGTIASYAWNYGDNSAVVTGTSPTSNYTYTANGTYTVTLTVTDNDGATTVATKSITVAANVAPTAAFTATNSGLTGSFDGSTSTDPDGTIASYAWDYGDGSAVATASTPTSSHAYTASGTYVVKLTVTDNSGATGTVSQSVSITTPVVATDAFNRTATNAWGSADAGGAWTTSGTASMYNVAGGSGTMKISTAGAAAVATLKSASGLNINGTVDVALSAVPTTGTYVALYGRVNGTTSYRTQLVLSSSSTTISVIKTVSGTDTTVKQATVPGLVYTAGDVVRVRLQIVGSGGTSTIQARAWKTTATEPTAWQVTGTDTTAALQTAGGIALRTYLASSATAPVTASFSNLAVTTNTGP